MQTCAIRGYARRATQHSARHRLVHKLPHKEKPMDASKASELNANIRSTIEQLANETDAARQSELFRNYLKTSAAFWNYSWHNQMLIYRQRADASYVAGYNTWLKCGRYVRKGEKGIAILAPMFFKDKTRAQDGSETDTKRIWFRIVYVFDRLSRDLWPSLCAPDRPRM
jgi:hypothetical protein